MCWLLTIVTTVAEICKGNPLNTSVVNRENKNCRGANLNPLGVHQFMTRVSRNPSISFKRNSPIFSSEQLPKPIVCKPMKSTWLQAISSKYWATNFTGDLNHVVSAKNKVNAVKVLRLQLQLRDIILNMAGEEVCMPLIEEDLSNLLTYGEAWLPTNIRIMRGEPSRCHQNAALLWEANTDKLFMATGYYLHSDGMWRSHSWCIRPTTRGGRIVETTRVGLLYFGVTLTETEAESRLSEL